MTTNCTQRTSSDPRVEHQDHNFMGKTTSKGQCFPSEQCEGDEGIKMVGNNGDTKFVPTGKLSNLTFCDTQIKNRCCENTNLLMKYNKRKEKKLTLKNVCFDLLKMKGTNLHNKFVSFCCYNNTNKTSANQILRSKCDSNTIRRRRSQSRVVVIMQLCLFLLSCLSIVSYVESFQSNCPTICTCKWKNGKNKVFNTYLCILILHCS